MVILLSIMLNILYNHLLGQIDNRYVHRFQLYDPIHNVIPNQDWNLEISIIINSSTVFIMLENYLKNNLDSLFLQFTIICYIRLMCTYLVPLQSPIHEIPIVYYPKQVFKHYNINHTYDYLFSGHTSVLVLCILNSQFTYLYSILCIALMYMLLSQQVHYTIDILFAPFVVYTINNFLS